ncbi:hypothetical protein [Pedobacter namyangjuensis]|uniref:hypothetical protein n=1 Tax=Pedobacter namyangjuensis TaxID=600626 RepID=UPI000DE556C5|nr:hypothetical protein [Pedobacter namyangjuensis]
MEVGWKQIWALYGWKELFNRKNRLFYFSWTVSAIATILLFFAESTTYSIITKVVEVCNAIMPTLLGFNLGAYALIIGFLSNKNLLNALVTKNDTDRFDRLQRISGVFAINIIAQAFTLLCSFLLKIFLELSIPSFSFCVYGIESVLFINIIVFLLIFFFTLYSVVLLIQNAINIFDFSQLFTYFATKEDDQHSS